VCVRVLYMDAEFAKRLFDLCNRLRPLKFGSAVKKISSEKECICDIGYLYNVCVYYIMWADGVCATRLIRTHRYSRIHMCIHNATLRPPRRLPKGVFVLQVTAKDVLCEIGVEA